MGGIKFDEMAQNVQSNDSEMRACIGGVAKQMENFDFLFGIELRRMVLNVWC